MLILKGLSDRTAMHKNECTAVAGRQMQSLYGQQYWSVNKKHKWELILDMASIYNTVVSF